MKSDADRSREAWQLKAKQLEAEIRALAGNGRKATPLLHTLSKLCMFAAEEGDFLRAATKRLAKRLS